MSQESARTPIIWTSEIGGVSPERAFDVFTRQLASWWPEEYTWSGDVLDTIVIEPHQGGRCYEIGPHGFQCDWGRVLAWERGERLALTWQISPRREPEPNPARASTIDIRFEGDQSMTTVSFEHREIDRHGAGSDDYRMALASEAGWPWILDRYLTRVTSES